MMGLKLMYKFDSDSFIAEMESLEGVEETPIDYEDFEQEEYEKMNERNLRGGLENELQRKTINESKDIKKYRLL